MKTLHLQCLADSRAGDNQTVHIETVIVATETGYRSVGANENGGRWVVDKTPILYRIAEKSDGSQRLKLLGFIVDE
jgi:hypothetical protein